MSESCISSEIERSVLAETLPYKWLLRILNRDLRGNRGFESGLSVEDTNQMIHHLGNVKGIPEFPASMVTIEISPFQIDACHFITDNLLCTNHFFFRVRAWFEALRRAWLKRIFNDNERRWKFYLMHLFKTNWGIFIFDYNYAMKDLQILSFL